jgi:hypothetical protein
MDRRRRSLAWTGVGSLGLDLYSCVKTLHVLGATVLFGTGAGVTFFILKGHLSPAMRTPFFAMADIHRRASTLAGWLGGEEPIGAARPGLESRRQYDRREPRHLLPCVHCVESSRSDLRLYLPLSTLIRNYGDVLRWRNFLALACCFLSLARSAWRSRRVKVHLNGLAARW